MSLARLTPDQRRRLADYYAQLFVTAIHRAVCELPIGRGTPCSLGAFVTGQDTIARRIERGWMEQ